MHRFSLLMMVKYVDTKLFYHFSTIFYLQTRWPPRLTTLFTMCHNRTLVVHSIPEEVLKSPTVLVKLPSKVYFVKKKF
jgi:hypothetical protein